MKLVQYAWLAAALLLSLALSHSAQAQALSCQVDTDCYQLGAAGPAQFCASNRTCQTYDSAGSEYCGSKWTDTNDVAVETITCPKPGFTAAGPGCPKNNPFTNMLPPWASIYCCAVQPASQVCASVECGLTSDGCGDTVSCPGTCAAGKSCIENHCSDAEIRNGRVVPALPPFGLAGVGLALCCVAVVAIRKRVGS